MKLRLKDIPPSPAYVVFHDGYNNGAMEIWLADSIETANQFAAKRQTKLEQRGYNEAGSYRAYTKLPRIKVYKLHSFHVEEVMDAGGAA